MKKQENNIWNDWSVLIVIILIIAVLLLLNPNTSKSEWGEYLENCIDDCQSEFRACLDNVHLYNSEHGIQTTPADPKILSCLWGEDSCIQNCQRYNYKFWKAMGRPE